MKISVITVCKNEAETIEKTLVSVLNQSYKNFEIIVIDGKSTDGTLEILEKYRSHLAHFTSEKDYGIYNAMNKGLNAASGELLYFLNANDTLFDNFVFENVVRAFEKNPNAKLLFGDIIFLKKDGSLHFKVDFQKNYNDYWLFRHNTMCQQAIFYKKEAFKKFGNFNEKFKIAGDTERNMNFIIKNEAEALYLPVIIVNFLMGGISSNLRVRKILKKENKRLYKKYYCENLFHYLTQKFSNFIKFFAPRVFLKMVGEKNYKKYSSKRKTNVILVKNIKIEGS